MNRNVGSYAVGLVLAALVTEATTVHAVAQELAQAGGTAPVDRTILLIAPPQYPADHRAGRAQGQGAAALSGEGPQGGRRTS